MEIIVLLIVIATFGLIYKLKTSKKIKDEETRIKEYNEYHSNKDLLYKDVKLTVHNFGKRFKPYKIIENDNMLKSIVDDYEQRENEAINDLKNRLSTVLEKDIIWSILQKLYIESILNNHKLFLNTIYQQGLLLQKEKKFEQAISHYSYGLYYLMNFYPSNFNPQNHIIDFVSNDKQIIEISQYKLINKIRRCIIQGNINLEKSIELSKQFIKITPLSEINIDEFIKLIDNNLDINKIQKENNFIEETIIIKNNDLIEGYEFNATLQLRTPLRILKHHKEIFKQKNLPLPKYLKEDWEGIWLPITKSYRELGFDIDEVVSSGCSTDIGYLKEDEENKYYQFLLNFHQISESNNSILEKIRLIKEASKNDKNFNKYFKKLQNKDKYFLENYFGLLIRNVVPSKISKILEDNGYVKKIDLKNLKEEDLLKIKGIGKNTIEKLKEFF